MKSLKSTKKEIKLKPKARLGVLSDFLLNASPEEQNRVFTEAARRASEDQREVMRKAGWKFKVEKE